MVSVLSRPFGRPILTWTHTHPRAASDFSFAGWVYQRVKMLWHDDDPSGFWLLVICIQFNHPLGKHQKRNKLAWACLIRVISSTAVFPFRGHLGSQQLHLRPLPCSSATNCSWHPQATMDSANILQMQGAPWPCPCHLSALWRLLHSCPCPFRCSCASASPTRTAWRGGCSRRRSSYEGCTGIQSFQYLLRPSLAAGEDVSADICGTLDIFRSLPMTRNSSTLPYFATGVTVPPDLDRENAPHNPWPKLWPFLWQSNMAGTPKLDPKTCRSGVSQSYVKHPDVLQKELSHDTLVLVGSTYHLDVCQMYEL